MGRVRRCSTQRAGCLDGRYARCSRYGLRGLIATGTDVLTRTGQYQVRERLCLHSSTAGVPVVVACYAVRRDTLHGTLAFPLKPYTTVVRNFTYDVVRG